MKEQRMKNKQEFFPSSTISSTIRSGGGGEVPIKTLLQDKNKVCSYFVNNRPFANSVVDFLFGEIGNA
jgi:hypothetical protein